MIISIKAITNNCECVTFPRTAPSEMRTAPAQKSPFIRLTISN